MAIVNAIHAGNNTATATNTIQVTIGALAHTLYIVDVININTPGSLGSAPTITSPNMTWTSFFGRTDGQSPSPGARMTRYRGAATQSFTSETLTATISGGAQAGMTIEVTGFNGVDLSGGSASAIVQTNGAASGVAVTTLATPITLVNPPAGPNSAEFGTFYSSNGTAITPEVYWAEIVDLAAGGGGRFETQFNQLPDQTLNCVAGSGVLTGILTELAPTPNAINVSAGQIGGFANASAAGTSDFTTTTVFRAGRALFLSLCSNIVNTETDCTITVPPNVTATQLHLNNNGKIFKVWQLAVSGTADITGPLRLFFNGTDASRTVNWHLIEAQNVDTSIGTSGVVASANANIVSSGTISMPPAASPNNVGIVFGGASGSAPAANTLWIQDARYAGATAGLLSAHRANAAAPIVNLTGLTGAGTGYYMAELARLIPKSKPAIALVSPPEGSIAYATPIVVDITDPDGDLSTVQIKANGVNAFNGAVSGGFLSGFAAGSTKTVIANGYRFSVARDGGWAPGSVTLVATATDAAGGLSGTSAFSYTAPPIVTHPPSVALVSPTAGGSIGASAPIVVDVTDTGGDLSTIRIQVNGADAFNGAVGGAFLAGFATGSTKTAITNGYRFSVAKDGGWAPGNVSLVAAPTDARGDTSTSAYSFTAPPLVTFPPAVALVSPSGAILSGDPVVFDLTDPDGDIASYAVSATVPGATETVCQGGTFAPAYATSTTQTIAGGTRLTIRRAGGWPVGVLALALTVVDAKGHATSATFDFAVNVAPGPPEELVPPSDGEDIWLDVVDEDADRQLTTNGDWRSVGGDDALRQSLVRRIITNPDDWRTLPDYGCGAPLYVNARHSKARRDELAERIRAQLPRDNRVAAVLSVDLTPVENGLIVKVSYLPRSKAIAPAAQTLALQIGAS